MGTFDCGAQDLGLGVKTEGRPPLLLLVGIVFPRLLFPPTDSPKTEVANVVAVGGGEKDRGRSRFDDSCADEETAGDIHQEGRSVGTPKFPSCSESTTFNESDRPWNSPEFTEG